MNHPETSDGAENKMSLLLWQGKTEIEFGGDFIIPDTRKDIRTVLWSEFRPMDQKTESGEGTVTRKGNVTATFVYLADDGTLSYCVFTVPYEEEIPAPGVRPGTEIFSSVSVTERSVKTINSRKIRISAKVGGVLFAFSEEETAPVIRGLSPSGMATVKKRKSPVRSSMLTANRTVSIPVSTDITVSGSLPPIGEIAGGEMTVLPISAEAEENAVRITYENRFSFLCRGENGSNIPLKKKMRQSETVEVPGCRSGDRVVLNTGSGEIRGEIGEDSFGEKRVLEADAVCSFTVTVFREEENLLTEDLYSTLYPSGMVSEREEKTVLLLRTASGGYSHNVSFPREECGAPSAVSVLDSHAVVTVSGTESDRFRQKLIISGKLELTALTVEVGEDGNAVSGIASAVSPFRCELDPGSLPEGEVTFPVRAFVSDCSCRMDSGKLYFDTELYFDTPVFAFSSCRRVKEAEFTEEPIEKKDVPSVILCYPSEQESLWDIAKKYRSTTEALLSANRMTEKDLPKKTVLLIPTDAV